MAAYEEVDWYISQIETIEHTLPSNIGAGTHRASTFATDTKLPNYQIDCSNVVSDWTEGRQEKSDVVEFK